MSHSSDEFSILDNRTAAHALHNAAGDGQQLWIRYPDQKIPPAAAVPGIDLQDLHRIIPGGIACHRGADGGTSGFYI